MRSSAKGVEHIETQKDKGDYYPEKIKENAGDYVDDAKGYGSRIFDCE
jgi:hypothetical protein